jgi:thiol-disulfide isomerase/thioredoxin
LYARSSEDRITAELVTGSGRPTLRAARNAVAHGRVGTLGGPLCRFRHAEKRRGSLDGFDAYLTALRDADRTKRRDKVLGARLANPEAVPVFNLNDLTGKRVSLDSLKGKIVVINYWGIWGNWCIQELPDYQKLYEKYDADPDVPILTIDNDANRDEVPPWMTQKKYTFPVLLDE